jgi:hypothetical protein
LTAKANASDTSGAGFSMLTPLPATKAYMVNNDLDFAKQVLAHNAFCAKQPGCRK